MANAVLGALFVLYLGLLVQDRFAPARAMPEIDGPWRLWGVFFWALTVVVNGALPYLLRPVFARHHLLDFSSAPEVPAALLGFAAYDLGVYWLHRLWHRVPWLWRWVHQMHHAPERMDPAGMCFFHPVEIVALAVASTTFYGFVLGFSPETGALAGTVFVAFGMFQHSNLSTPRWLGLIVQRPEQHGVHHQRGVHGGNYSDLPLWDLLFGTFENPRSWNEQAGLEDGALKKWRSLLLGRRLS